MMARPRRPPRAYWEKIKEDNPATVWIDSNKRKLTNDESYDRIYFEIEPNKKIFKKSKRFDFCFGEKDQIENGYYYGCYSKKQNFPDSGSIVSLWRMEDPNVLRKKKRWRVEPAENYSSSPNQKTVIFSFF